MSHSSHATSPSTAHGRKRVVLVRHGETEGSASGRFVGRSEIPLSRAGREQALRLADPLARAFPAACWTSPIGRARETAELALGSGAELNIDETLAEIDFGRWEGQSFEQVEARDPLLVRAWVEHEGGFVFPDGESVADFVARTESAATRIEDAPAATVVAFTHGGVIRMLLCHWLGLDALDHRIFEIACGTMTTVELRDGNGTLTGLNLLSLESSTWHA